MLLFPAPFIGGNSGGIVGREVALGARYRGGGGARLGLRLAAPQILAQRRGKTPLAALLLRAFRTIAHGEETYDCPRACERPAP